MFISLLRGKCTIYIYIFIQTPLSSFRFVRMGLKRCAVFSWIVFRRTELQSCATAPHWSIRSIAGSYIRSYEMNEWMMHLYSALLCIVVHPKRFTVMWGGSFLNHHQCAASIWMMRRLPQDNGTSALTTHQLQVERRESHRANQVDGDY